MKHIITLILLLVFQIAISQNLTFSNTNLKTYLLSTNSVDTNGDEIADALIDTNNDNEIQLSEALLIENLVISPNPGLTITNIQDIYQFKNLKRLTIPGDFGLTEISNLELDSLNFIRVSDHNSIINIDLSDLPNLSSIIIEGLNGVQSLNLQNGTYASSYFSLFYTYVDYACVDSIYTEYNYVSQHLTDSGYISLDCTLEIVNNGLSETNIYPNPTTGKVLLSSVAENIRLLDLHGRILREWNFRTNEIDIFDLIEGMYILEIDIGSIITRRKIIRKSN